MTIYIVDNYRIERKIGYTRVIEGILREDQYYTPPPLVAVFLYSGRKYAGRIFFYPDHIPLPPPVLDDTGPYPRIFLSHYLKRFPDVMDLIRNEKPIGIYYTGPSDAGITTGKEPIGEEESV